MAEREKEGFEEMSSFQDLFAVVWREVNGCEMGAERKKLFARMRAVLIAYGNSV